MEKEDYIVKSDKCKEHYFISPKVITSKRDGATELAFDSKMLIGQIFKNKYKIQNIHD